MSSSDNPGLTIPVRIEPATADDVPYIMSTWKNSLREAYAGFSKAEYFRWANQAVERAATAPGVETLVARPPEGTQGVSPDLVVAWLAHIGNDLLYAYVRQTMRRRGLLYALRDAADMTGQTRCLFWTPNMGRVAQNSRKHFVYTPQKRFL